MNHWNLSQRLQFALGLLALAALFGSFAGRLPTPVNDTHATSMDCVRVVAGASGGELRIDTHQDHKIAGRIEGGATDGEPFSCLREGAVWRSAYRVAPR